MKRLARWPRPAACLLLVAALALPGCTARQNAPVANAAAQLRAPAASDKAATVKYLKAALKDLAVIDEIVDDEELGLTQDVDASGDETMTDAQAARYTEVLDEYIGDINDAIRAIGTRETPKNADIEAFRSAELAEFELLDELLDEYLQVLGYYDLMMQMEDDMSGFSEVNVNDLEGTYKAYNAAFMKAIDTMKNGDIPSCLKSMNDSLVAALTEANDSVLYLLQAIALDDPLRMDAAEYRLGILMRRLEKVGTGLEQDLLDRQKKLVDDAKSIQKTNDGLRQWLQSNIDKLR
jgi:hypothetical protein